MSLRRVCIEPVLKFFRKDSTTQSRLFFGMYLTVFKSTVLNFFNDFFFSAACNQRVVLLSDTCLNPACTRVTANPGGGSSTVKTQFELGISLSDHTGTISNCRLTEPCAESMCGCKVRAASIKECLSISYYYWSLYTFCFHSQHFQYKQRRSAEIVRFNSTLKLLTVNAAFLTVTFFDG